MWTRRDLLLKSGQGFGAVALAGMLNAGNEKPSKAKSIIYLFMHGGVSHVDTFDPKPELQKRTGQPLSL